MLTESVPVSWNIATIQFTNDEFFSNEQISVKVVDVDMNLNPEAIDQIPIQLYSDSDAAGITVNAIETSENSGVLLERYLCLKVPLQVEIDYFLYLVIRFLPNMTITLPT